MKASEAMLRVALELEGVHEVGFNNRGPQVEEIQKADDLPGGGYAWCVSFKQFLRGPRRLQDALAECERGLPGERLP